MNIAMPAVLIFIMISFLVMGVVVGMFAGSKVANTHLYRGLNMALRSVLRILVKTMKRKRTFIVDPIRLQSDKDFLCLTAFQKEVVVDQRSLKITTELKSYLQQQYGSRLKRVYLYGSRARGDYHSDSDIDIAIFLAFPFNDHRQVKEQLLRETFALLLKYGFYVQPRVYDSRILDQVEYFPDYLAKAALSYGILV